jgi:hypothetical protein
MPGTPATTPNLALPRFSQNDSAQFAPQVNSVVDKIDTAVPSMTDPRLSDQRVPTDGSVTNAKVAANAAIDQNKLSLNIDAAPGTPSLRTLGTGPNQAVAGDDPRFSTPAAPAPHAATHTDDGPDPVPGVVPIGTVIAYAGSALPTLAAGQAQRWAWADGSLINRSTYATFYNRVGHAYNGNVDPGSGTPGQGTGGSGPLVRLPDKRGRSSVGAINFGQGAGPATNARAQVARGGGAGEVNHTLLDTESGVNRNGSVVAVGDHGHYIQAESAASIAGGVYQTGQNPYGLVPCIQGVSVALPTHSHTGATGQAGAHGHALNRRDADATHNNLHPYEADNFIVRIA